MHRRHFLHLTIAAAVAAGMSGCSRRDHLRTGIHPWIGYEPLYLAEEFGWLPETVQLVKGRAASDSISGLVSGNLDAAALTLDETLRVLAAGVPVKAVAVTNVSVGADVLLVRPAITSLSDLQGRRVAVELGGVSGIMLFSVLERAGLTSNNISVVDLPVHEHIGAWQRGDIDASISYEPEASRLVAEGAVRLFDSSQLPETIFDLLVVTDAAASRQPAAVRDLVKGHFLGLQHLVRNMHDAVYRVATRQEVSPDMVRQSLATVMLPELSANHRYLTHNGRLEVVAKTLASIMVREGLMDKPLRYEHLTDPAFLPRSLP
ncbi:ABC transporter substrate-binding protein [Marinobacter hydrocarbonoclasticus]|uniref:ABC transporter substrate-binding protein n=1 Tax=Marinobacter nauticus TaxID=2743 RepID=UPI001A8E1833|nr:ABC transporter substrate-binding protein [Marinobacter nauticus]MBN8239606.1 ABC transporter substrate-binding protein [Marinobacter nauticus]